MEEFNKGIKAQPRTLKALTPVLYQKARDPSDLLEASRVVYDVWRGIFNLKNLRYDITKIYSSLVSGRELPKTFGHYHRKIKNQKSKIKNLIDGVEVFEVISGRAWCLIQKYENDPKIIKEVYLIEGVENEKIIILPDFGIVSINPGDRELALANLISPDVKNEYQYYANLSGACYYAVENEKGSVDFIKNLNYKEMPELIKLKPKEIPELGIIWSKSLASLIKTPAKLEFLNEPEKYKELLTIKNCYEISNF